MKIIKEFGYKPLPIEFKELSHRYKLKALPLIGTTTVINVKAKDFLKWWTVKLMYQVLDEKWDIAKVYTKEEKEALLLEGKEAHTIKLSKAGDSGKEGHKWIEKSINDEKRFKIEEIIYEDKQMEQEVRNIYLSFLDWEKTHEIEYLATELIVGSEELWTGGTIDAIAIIDGKLELLDWKSSKQLSEDVFIQTAGYKYKLIERGVDPEIRRRVIRFGKEKVEFEDVLITSPYEEDVKCFKALLQIYRWNKYQDKKNLLNKPQYNKFNKQIKTVKI